MPPDLIKEVRRAAKRTGLSMADTMRQSMKIGLPQLIEKLASDKPVPLTEEELRLAYCTPNPEFDALEHHCASLPKRPLEED